MCDARASGGGVERASSAAFHSWRAPSSVKPKLKISPSASPTDSSCTPSSSDCAAAQRNRAVWREQDR
eukprot:251952-Prymnesium_polylepis.2